MNRIILILAILTTNQCIAQDISFKKADLRVKEPYKSGIHKRDTFNIEILADKLPTEPIKLEVQKASESKYPDSLFKFVKSKIDTLKAKNTISVSVATHMDSDEDLYVILSANWKTPAGESRQSKDTLFISNSYPFKGVAEKDYTDWNDCKRAEIFIGTNFDFINSKVTLSDWYGGARVFLPSITDFRFKRDKSNRSARWGFAGGIYHAKSLSNFGNTLNNTQYTSVYGRIIGVATDSSSVRFDTVKTTLKHEINNWGLYIAPLWHLSRYESSDGKFVTNIYVGAHFEVIRRNVTTGYTFDTIGNTVRKYKNDQVPRNLYELPPTNTQTYYDSYYGISMPVQFLWKDILEIKFSPSVGVGSRDYSSQNNKPDEEIRESPMFYLMQFDLLARLGGLRLNIGGEVRGYFPKERPIITAYLGTSFTIQKLVDFVTK